MGSEEAAPLTELNVKIDEPVYVKPAQPCENTSPFFLTNADQMLAFTVETMYFYAANPEKPSDKVADTLKLALSMILVHYDFLAGRVRLNEELKRMEIDRNDAGAQFATASCDLTLAELGDLSVPNALFRKFVPQAHNATTISEIPLMMIQVTTFKCGGHAIGFGMSHLVWDGHGVVDFLFNLMSLARGGPLVSQPKPNRDMFKARDPPTPLFDHPEYLKRDDLAKVPSLGGPFTTPEAAESEFEGIAPSLKHITKVVPFSAKELATLKVRAMAGGVLKKVSTFEALAGHVWQARVKAIDAQPQEIAQLLYAVDVRDRLDPPVPKGFVGNALHPACARATCEEVRNGPLSLCVQEIQRANEKITNDYIRSGIDWWEVYRGVPAVTSGIFITSWQKMPFYSIDFGWGKPVFAGPAVHPMVEFVIFLPTCHQNGSLNVVLCLQPDVMTKFQEYCKV